MPLEEIQRAVVLLGPRGLGLAVVVKLYVCGGKEPAPAAAIAEESARAANASLIVGCLFLHIAGYEAPVV